MPIKNLEGRGRSRIPTPELPKINVDPATLKERPSLPRGERASPERLQENLERKAARRQIAINKGEMWKAMRRESRRNQYAGDAILKSRPSDMPMSSGQTYQSAKAAEQASRSAKIAEFLANKAKAAATAGEGLGRIAAKVARKL